MNALTDEQRKKLFQYIKPISLKTPDYYQLGLNTRIVFGNDIVSANKVITIFSSQLAVKYINDFWSGYHFGVENLLYYNEELQ
jgi:hypothetical protein